MTQTNHSELMNDMDRVTQELVRLMAAFAQVSAERNTLRDNVAMLLQDDFRMSCELTRALQESQDKTAVYDQSYNELAAKLAEEEKYADSLHDSLSEMKMVLRQVNDDLVKEKKRYKDLYCDVYSGHIAAGMDDPAYLRSLFDINPKKKSLTPWQLKSDELAAEKEVSANLRAEIAQMQEKHRKETDQLRHDLGEMYALRDAAREERDRFASELLKTIEEMDTAVAERDKAVEDKKKAVAAYNEEFDEHSKTLMESSNLRSAMGRTVAKYNELRYNMDCCVYDNDNDSVS